MLKLGYSTSISEDNLPRLMMLSRMLDERLNRAPNAHAPYVAEASFRPQGRLARLGSAEGSSTYEHVPPEKVNKRQYLISDQAGKSNMLARFADFGIDVCANDAQIDKLIDMSKNVNLRAGLLILPRPVSN